jgi:hypothetical protein
VKKIFAYAAVAAAIACLPAPAENSQERARRVIDDCVTALGGPKFENVKSVVLTGRAYSFYREQLNGLSIARIARLWLDDVKDPSRKLAVLEREDFGKKFDWGVLFLQDDAYDITFRGARPLPTERVERYKLTTMYDIFYILRERLHEPGLILESRGADVWDNVPVEIVDITDKDNQTVTVYFHKSTKLPVRQVFSRLDPKTRERNEEVTLYTKYREVDGVQWPMTVQRNRNGEKVYEMFADDLEINLPEKKLPPTMFELPSGVKKLKRES